MARAERTDLGRLREAYQAQGFVKVPGLISPAEAERWHGAALDWAGRVKSDRGGTIFTQWVNVWREDPVLRELTLDPGVARVAAALAGGPLRLWHDHLLIKWPRNRAATEFHQDQPYWPHARSTRPLSAWVALVDVPVERGCMSFLPGSHRRDDLAMQNLGDARSLFQACPDLEWSPRVTLPLRAGDATFHHGRCAHMAGPNETDVPRVAHVIIYMDADAVFRAHPDGHPVTDPLGLKDGDPLDGDLFPAPAAG